MNKVNIVYYSFTGNTLRMVQPFMKRNAEKFKDKKVYLFGTFGWGTGKFMGTWIKQVEELGAKIVELPMACKGSPNAETKEKLSNMAKKIATM